MKIIKSLTATMAIFTLAVLAVSFFPMTASAQFDPYKESGNVGDTTGLGSKSPVEITISLIQLALGFLGLIAVVIILIGGFKWMTAGGNEDKIGEAKKMIIQGIIGLVIVLAAWGIATYVIGTAFNLTNG
jgi:hypothetical protein